MRTVRVQASHPSRPVMRSMRLRPSHSCSRDCSSPRPLKSRILLQPSSSSRSAVRPSTACRRGMHSQFLFSQAGAATPRAGLGHLVAGARALSSSCSAVHLILCVKTCSTWLCEEPCCLASTLSSSPDDHLQNSKARKGNSWAAVHVVHL